MQVTTPHPIQPCIHSQHFPFGNNLGEAYVTLSCLGGNYPLIISTNQNVIYIDNIKCQINESIFSKNKRVNLNHKVTLIL